MESHHTPDGRRQSDMIDRQGDYEAAIDWSYANSKASKVTFNDHTYDFPVGYYGNENLLIENGAGKLVSYNVKTDQYETLVSLKDGALKTIIPFFDLKKIFYTATSISDGNTFLWGYDVNLKQSTKIVQVENSGCASYPTETRIKKKIATRLIDI